MQIKKSIVTALLLLLTFTTLKANDPSTFPEECEAGWFKCVNDSPYPIDSPEHAAYINGCVNSWLGCIGAE